MAAGNSDATEKMWVALRKNDEAALEEALLAGADPNDDSKSNNHWSPVPVHKWTPLMAVAYQTKPPQLALVLLQYGANPYALTEIEAGPFREGHPDLHGLSAVQVALRFKSDAAVNATIMHVFLKNPSIQPPRKTATRPQFVEWFKGASVMKRPSWFADDSVSIDERFLHYAFPNRSAYPPAKIQQYLDIFSKQHIATAAELRDADQDALVQAGIFIGDVRLLKNFIVYSSRTKA